MREVLQVHVVLDGFQSVRGKTGEATMILFHGTFSCEHGEGIVLPGGVDTQIQKDGQERTLSARYILKGNDKNGNIFHLFIENNGIYKEEQQISTTPRILTDCEELNYLEEEELSGTVETAGEGRVLIRIFGS